MLFKIKFNLMHHLYGAQSRPLVPVWGTHGVLVSEGILIQLLTEELQDFNFYSVSLLNDNGDNAFDGMDWQVFRPG